MNQTIPKVLHRAWLGPYDEPKWTRGFAPTWERPGWELVQWNNSTVKDLFPLDNQGVWDHAPDIVADQYVGQFRSDILRYEILDRFGGVWIDTDMESLKPLDELVDGIDLFTGWEIQGVCMNNALMGAAPGHPLIKRLIEMLPLSIEHNPGFRPNKISGPQFLTRQWSTENISVYPSSYFYPFGYDEVAQYRPSKIDPAEEWPDAYACHWWANQRRVRKVSV